MTEKLPNPSDLSALPAYLQTALCKIGLEALDMGFASLVACGREWAERGRRGEKQRAFAYDPSLLRIGPAHHSKKSRVIVIDVGGTHTKAALADLDTDGSRKWQMLFDQNTPTLDRPELKLLPIERFATVLAEKTASALDAVDTVDGIGFVWSNILFSQRLNTEDSGGVVGVTGVASGIESGKFYRKGEFFAEGLQDGVDIGAIFLSAMRNQGLKPRAFIMGNDTIFTLKATPGADGGMVASTGANATAVDSQGWIYNTEMGGLFPIPDNLLCMGERILLEDRGSQGSIKLEDLIAGRWLPRVFEGYIVALWRAGIESLNPLAHHLLEHSCAESPFFTGKDLGVLLEEGRLQCSKVNDPKFNDLAPLLKQIAQIVAARAGKLAGLMGYLCLLQPLARKEQVLLSLDSTQARYLPGYFEAMQASLNELAGGAKRAQISLRQPKGAIAVPMEGLAIALGDELQ
ncbi:MAG: ROK family protein [Deltaproteobacteria bacterium]|nr:ROK family protein [Deltaproteobacteria bacterium]